MKTAFGTFAALLVAGALYVPGANAQPAPQGSYLNSCTHVGMDHGKLTADCRRTDGRWQRTVVDVDRCAGDIGNTNGHLTCDREAREGYGSSAEDHGLWENRARCWHIVNPAERERCWWGR
jgi:CVNH domain